jgi:hypothetical protein
LAKNKASYKSYNEKDQSIGMATMKCTCRISVSGSKVYEIILIGFGCLGFLIRCGNNIWAV